MVKWPNIDFRQLKELNSDTIGWIYLEGTPLNYPVVQGHGDDYYLKHNFTFEPSPHGCIYAEPGEAFPGRRSVLNGHNMKDFSMFTSLLLYYCEEGFFDEHPVIDLKTPEADYEIRVWGSVQFPRGYGFAAHPPRDEEAFAQWKQAMINLCPFEAPFDLQCDDDIMVFCTCRPHKNNEAEGTLIVIGKVLKREQKNIYLTLVNRKHPMDFGLLEKIVLKEYSDMPGYTCTVEEETLEHYKQLKEYVSQYGVTMGICSGFRSYDYQAKLYPEIPEEHDNDAEEASRYIASPGESEHHTGLAVDIIIDNNEKIDDITYMARAYTIIHTACPYFGFIVRYPQNKCDVTGYAYEPWHLRYVGKEAATVIGRQKITLEEYLL